MKLKIVLLSAALCASHVAAFAADAYYRFPALRGNTVVFTAEGDLWKATTEGGTAQRLTTHTSPETHAAISPDGQMLAFTAFYEGTPEAYVMPMAGGLPKRISFENTSVRVLGWTPQGEVLVAMQHATGPASYPVVAAIQWQSLNRRVFPVAEANDAVLDGSGRYLYFTRFGLQQMAGDNARRYRGGLKAQIWRFDLQGKDEAVAVLAAKDANFKRPMWSQGRLYFISDKVGADNLWSAAPDGRDQKQLTRHSDWDVRNAAIDGKAIAYQLGADLRLLDTASGADRRLSFALLSDFDQQRVRQIKSPMEHFSDADVANKEERILVTARGRVTSPSLNDKRRMDIAIPPGVRARNAVFSHDDKWVYAIADTTGENEIWRFPADGTAKAEQLTKGATVLRWSVYPSPDGKWLAHTDKRGRLWLMDLATRLESVIDDAFADGVQRHEAVVWAPDSKALALVREVGSDDRQRIAIYQLESKKLAWVSGNRFHSFAPAFSPDGRWLYFLSNRNFELGNGSVWGDRNMGPVFDRRTGVFALALQAGNRFGFKSDDELSSAEAAKKPEAKKPEEPKKADEKKTDDKKVDDKKSEQKKPEEPKLPAIQMDGLAQRLYAVPLAAGNYRDLAVDAKRLYYLEADGTTFGKHTLRTLAIEKNGPKPDTFAADVRSFALSGDGKRVLYRSFASNGPGDFLLVDAGAKQPGDISKQRFRLDDWYITLDPRLEWKQMLHDVWRLQRDYFFDHTMRGLDWASMKGKYFPLVERVTDRDELNDVIALMTAELGALHSQIVPGDVRRAGAEGTPAALGAQLEKVATGYRIERIFQGARDVPTDRSPLAPPDVDVRVGDVITAVNGKPVLEARHIADLLLNQSGLQTRLDLARDGKAIAPVIVRPVTQARQATLRYSDWEESRAARADDQSKGRIGYLHLRAMGPGDIATFAREFYANLDKDGLIIDVRRNGGGNVDSWIIEKLLRKTWAFWTDTHGHVAANNMQQGFRGHLVVLADELTYSDGETFAAGVKTLGLAPVVGKTTAGAGVWLTDATRLSDGGRARTAELAQFFAADGKWMIEGTGVAPDVEVDNPPHASFRGEDKQLDTAIQMLLKKMAESPVKKLQPGPMAPMTK